MSAASKLPTLLTAQWSTIADPMPTLAAPLQPDDTTAYFSSPLYDGTGTKATGGFHFAIKNSAGYTMTCYVAAGGVAADGLSATIVQGIDTEGLDYSTSNPDLIPDEGFSAGDAISCNIPGVLGSLLQAVIKGTIATGGTGFTFGTEAGDGAEIITLYRTTTAGAKKGFLRWHTSGKIQYSNDGTNWVNIDSVSASNLVTVSANDTTPGYLNGKLVAGTNTTLTENNDGADETLQVNAAGPLASIVTDVTASAAEINTPLDGVSANVTAANLNTLTAGASSSADALHSHSTPALSGMAYEAISQYDAVASLPIEVQYYTPMTEVDSNLGNANSSRKFAMKVVPSRDITDLTAILFRAKEAVNGATVGNMSFRIETDSASAPSGTLAHANATASFTQATLRTWTATYGTRTATLAGAVTLSKGTTYWLVWSMDTTDAANYIKMGDASSYDENYLTFTRLTYNVDTATWGSSSTVLPLFFWTTPSVSLGSALCKTDDDYVARKFNFVGFATAAASANAACSYYYDSVPGLTIVPGLRYSLSGTAGAITNTAPAYGYQIGYAFVDSAGNKMLKILRGKKLANFSNSSVASSTTQNIDTFHLTGFKLDAGEIDYILTGEASGAAKATVAKSFLSAAGILGSGITFIYDTATGTSITSSTITSYAAQTTQPGGAGANLAVTISIINITEMGFTVRLAFTAGSSPSSRTSSYGGLAIG